MPALVTLWGWNFELDPWYHLPATKIGIPVRRFCSCRALMESTGKLLSFQRSDLAANFSVQITAMERHIATFTQTTVSVSCGSIFCLFLLAGRVLNHHACNCYVPSIPMSTIASERSCCLLTGLLNPVFDLEGCMAPHGISDENLMQAASGDNRS
jgi:hypothetical protein